MELEERPVADSLEDIPIPAATSELVGHGAALSTLVQNYASGRMHHAWLISGPRGVGKATLAFTIAKHIFAHSNQSAAPDHFDPDTVSKAISRQVANGGHPELLHLTRPWDAKTKKFKTQLSVEEVRRTSRFYGMTAGAGGWRITIVDAADDMNASAANALLKILEEPPKRSVFFVLTHAAGGLLPTIRSRCQSLPLTPLAQSEVEQIISKFNIEATTAERTRAAELSEGSVRRTIQLLQGEVLKEYGLFESLMKAQAIGAGKDWLAVHQIADSLSRRGQEQSYALFLDLVCAWVGRQVNGQTGRPLNVLAGWAEVWEKINQSVTLADAFNLDKKQVVLSLFGHLFECNKS